MPRVSFGLGFPLGREKCVRNGCWTDVAWIVGVE